MFLKVEKYNSYVFHILPLLIIGFSLLNLSLLIGRSSKVIFQ